MERERRGGDVELSLNEGRLQSETGGPDAWERCVSRAREAFERGRARTRGSEWGTLTSAKGDQNGNLFFISNLRARHDHSLWTRTDFDPRLPNPNRNPASNREPSSPPEQRCTRPCPSCQRRLACPSCPSRPTRTFTKVRTARTCSPRLSDPRADGSTVFLH